MDIFGVSIYSRVMKVLKAKIEEAQKAYDEGCKVLDEKLVDDKAELADKVVTSIVGKIL